MPPPRTTLALPIPRRTRIRTGPLVRSPVRRHRPSPAPPRQRLPRGPKGRRRLHRPSLRRPKRPIAHLQASPRTGRLCGRRHRPRTSHTTPTCRHRELEVVKLLVEKRANCMLKDADGKTALHRAAANGHFEVCEYLIKTEPKLRGEVDKHEKRAADYVPGGELLRLVS